jgi:hypothetical protein
MSVLVGRLAGRRAMRWQLSASLCLNRKSGEKLLTS